MGGRCPQVRREKHERPDDDDEQDQDRCRQEPASPASVERPQLHGAGPVSLTEEVGGDQIARDDEEGVDADVTTGEGPWPKVVDHHQHDRDGPQYLDLGQELTARSLGYALRPIDRNGEQSCHPRFSYPDSSNAHEGANLPNDPGDSENPQRRHRISTSQGGGSAPPGTAST